MQRRIIQIERKPHWQARQRRQTRLMDRMEFHSLRSFMHSLTSPYLLLPRGSCSSSSRTFVLRTTDPFIQSGQWSPFSLCGHAGLFPLLFITLFFYVFPLLPFVFVSSLLPLSTLRFFLALQTQTRGRHRQTDSLTHSTHTHTHRGGRDLIERGFSEERLLSSLLEEREKKRESTH